MRFHSKFFFWKFLLAWKMRTGCQRKNMGGVKKHVSCILWIRLLTWKLRCNRNNTAPEKPYKKGTIIHRSPCFFVVFLPRSTLFSTFQTLLNQTKVGCFFFSGFHGGYIQRDRYQGWGDCNCMGRVHRFPKFLRWKKQLQSQEKRGEIHPTQKIGGGSPRAPYNPCFCWLFRCFPSRFRGIFGCQDPGAPGVTSATGTRSLCSTDGAIAALLLDGRVQVWGNAMNGGNLEEVPHCGGFEAVLGFVQMEVLWRCHRFSSDTYCN